MIFWQTAPPWGATTFFATYYYHGNAGAYLNLIWPLIAGLAVRAFTQPSHPGMRALWVSVLILPLAAVLANTSRMAQLMRVLLLRALCVQLGTALLRKVSHGEKNIALAGVIAILLTLFALGQATHLEQPLNRWQSVTKRISSDARWQASRFAIGALRDLGFFGVVPGTFRVVFPSYNNVANKPAPGPWSFLHQNCLQPVLCRR